MSAPITRPLPNFCHLNNPRIIIPLAIIVTLVATTLITQGIIGNSEIMKWIGTGLMGLNGITLLAAYQTREKPKVTYRVISWHLGSNKAYSSLRQPDEKPKNTALTHKRRHQMLLVQRQLNNTDFFCFQNTGKVFSVDTLSKIFRDHQFYANIPNDVIVGWNKNFTEIRRGEFPYFLDNRQKNSPWVLLKDKEHDKTVLLISSQIHSFDVQGEQIDLTKGNGQLKGICDALVNFSRMDSIVIGMDIGYNDKQRTNVVTNYQFVSDNENEPTCRNKAKRPEKRDFIFVSAPKMAMTHFAIPDLNWDKPQNPATHSPIVNEITLG